MTTDASRVTDRLLIGIGNDYRGDDAVGLLIVQRAAASLDGRAPWLRLAAAADPSALLDLWAGFDFVVIADAVRNGREPGTLLQLEVGADSVPLHPGSWTNAGLGGTHAFGLAATIELARVLGRLPNRVVVIGVEATQFAFGAEPSAPVATAVAVAVERALRLLLTEQPRPAHAAKMQGRRSRRTRIQGPDTGIGRL